MVTEDIFVSTEMLFRIPDEQSVFDFQLGIRKNLFKSYNPPMYIDAPY